MANADNVGGTTGPSELELLKTKARRLGIQFSNNIGLETLREKVREKMAEIAEPAEAAPTPKAAPVKEPVVEPVEQELPNPLGSPDEAGKDDDLEVIETPEELTETQTNLSRLEQMAEEEAFVAPTPSRGVISGSGRTAKGKTPTLAAYLHQEQMKLVNVRIQNMDPKKTDLQGEIITVANRYVGNVKRFIPFGETTDNGWLIPYILYKELKSRRFLHISEKKDPNTKKMRTVKRWVKEFAIELLPLPTEADLRRLAVQQAAAGSIDQSSDEIL